MAKRIQESKDAREVARQTNRALEMVELSSFVGYVETFKIANPTRSYLYLDNGILKFYNHDTLETKSVDLT